MPKKKSDLPIIIFSDGASLGNPGRGGWGSIIATPEGAVTELGGRQVPATNNQMEILAALKGLEFAAKLPGPVAVYTDSTYLIQGITQWIWGWRKKEWKTAEGKEVSNADLWKKLFGVVSKRGKEGAIEWHYVRGHVGTPGNERADEIATTFAEGKFVELYRGPLLKYDLAIHDIPEDTSLPERKPDSGAKKQPAYSYLSLVNGVFERHATWSECEARVKGRPAAKFKKAMSASDEEKIKKEWGVE